MILKHFCVNYLFKLILMISSILEALILMITAFIVKLNYWAVFIWMSLESANIPIPSEIVMPYAGFLASQGKMNIHLVALAGALGCLFGSMLSYYLGIKLGRPFLWKYGKWMLISQKDILIAENFLAKYGDLTFFITRVLPVVRTFISFVIGVAKGHFGKFCFYTFVGSWIWCYLLAYVGIKLGENWSSLRGLWHKFDLVIALVVIAAIAWHIYRVFKNSRAADLPEKKAQLDKLG
jgi:membrane protein DedA with SNARE-associated domain